MKRKRVATVPQQTIDEIVYLRDEKGLSWEAIGKKTKLDRRRVSSVYQALSKKRAEGDLLAIRTNVANNEFQKHLDSVVRGCTLLAIGLDLPESPDERRDADSFLDDLLPLERVSDLDLSSPLRKRLAARQRVRQRELFLESLRLHTEGRVQWDNFDLWKTNWNLLLQTTAPSLSRTVEESAKALLEQSTLKGNRAWERRQEVGNEPAAISWMGPLMEKAIWNNVKDKTKLRVQLADVARSAPKGFDEDIVINEVLSLCNNGLNKLGTRPLARILFQLSREMREMKNAIDVLNDQLNPLILRPLVLRRRCDLCPA